jgi:hypothetical protein
VAFLIVLPFLLHSDVRTPNIARRTNGIARPGEFPPVSSFWRTRRPLVKTIVTTCFSKAQFCRTNSTDNSQSMLSADSSDNE